MRCDLHVHTIHSGMCTLPVLRRICRESYSDPLSVYETLKRRGMDLVTVTDHDSIGACEPLRRFKDFFLSEEVTCSTPGGREIHVGVYDIQERHHVELERRRDDLPRLAAYLEEERLLFSVNHIFSGLTGARTDSDFAAFEEFFPAFETLNGQMPGHANRRAEALATRLRKAPLGGSDAHTLPSLGLTYTEVPCARNRVEFVDALRRGRGLVRGESGSYRKLTCAIWSIGREMMREKSWTYLLAPLAAAIPLATLINLSREWLFARKWSDRADRLRESTPWTQGSCSDLSCS